MPIVSADGVLHPKLFVQMQQKNGKWTAGASVFKAQNIVSVPATTHIMSNATYQTFVSNCLLPLLPRRVLLLHDSWSCFRNEEAAQLIKADRKKLELLQIPPHRTRHVQPLDVYFFSTIESV